MWGWAVGDLGGDKLFGGEVWMLSFFLQAENIFMPLFSPSLKQCFAGTKFCPKHSNLSKMFYNKTKALWYLVCSGWIRQIHFIIININNPTRFQTQSPISCWQAQYERFYAQNYNPQFSVYFALQFVNTEFWLVFFFTIKIYNDMFELFMSNCNH